MLWLAGIFYQRFNESFTALLLDGVFPLHGTGPVRVFLCVNQFPRFFLFCVLGSGLIVMFYSGLDVLRRADIIASVFEAFQDVHENRHTQL